MSLVEKHKHKKIQGKLTTAKSTLGERAADAIAYWGGSWTFIFVLLCFLFVWMTLNAVLIIKYKWDPYPFILLNLFLSCIAAIQAPIILMSQNRTAQRDRLKAEFDYRINKKTEKEVREIKNFLLNRKKKKK